MTKLGNRAGAILALAILLLAAAAAARSPRVWIASGPPARSRSMKKVWGSTSKTSTRPSEGSSSGSKMGS